MWDMELNTDKCKIILITNWKNVIKYKCKINGNISKSTNQEKIFWGDNQQKIIMAPPSQHNYKLCRLYQAVLTVEPQVLQEGYKTQVLKGVCKTCS